MSYRSGKVIVDSKKVDLEKCNEIYGDGRFKGSRGISVNFTKTEKILVEEWTNWQGESDEYYFVEPERALELLEKQEHKGRVARAIQELENRDLVEIEEV